jgi:hypothetical protein
MNTVSLHERLEISGLETEQIEWTPHLHQMAAADMDILESGLDGAMPQQQLNGVGIDTRIEQMRGKGVAQGVDARAWFDAGPCSGLVVNLLGRATGHGLVGFGAGEEPGPWTGDLPIGAQFDQQALGKQAVAIFVAFAVVEVTSQD